MNYRSFHQQDLILRDHLALDRTRLANERTFLAYLRTAIMVFVSGVSLIKLFPDSIAAQVSGWLLLPIATALALIGLSRFVRLARCCSDLDPFCNGGNVEDRKV